MRAPIALDAFRPVWPIASADRIICINMIHISPWEATVGLVKGAAAILPSKSPLYLYGSYKREVFEMAPSNQAFDQSLRDRAPQAREASRQPFPIARRGCLIELLTSNGILGAASFLVGTAPSKILAQRQATLPLCA